MREERNLFYGFVSRLENETQISSETLLKALLSSDGIMMAYNNFQKKCTLLA